MTYQIEFRQLSIEEQRNINGGFACGGLCIAGIVVGAIAVVGLVNGIIDGAQGEDNKNL